MTKKPQHNKFSDLRSQISDLQDALLEIKNKQESSVFIIEPQSLLIKDYGGNYELFVQNEINENTSIEQLISEPDIKLFRKRLSLLSESNPNVVFGLSLKAEENVSAHLIKMKSGNLVTVQLTKLFSDAHFTKLPNEINFRSLANSIADGILVGNNKGKIIGMNTAFTKLTGYNYDDIINKHISILFTKSILNKVPLRFDLLDAGENVINERQIKTKAGAPIAIEMNSSRIDSMRYIAAIRNISKRTTAENALAKTTDRFEKLFKDSPLGILLCNNSGDISEINKAFLKILGSDSPEKTKEINLLDFKPLQKTGFSDNLRKSFEKQEPFQKEYKYNSYWGKESYMKIYFVPLNTNSNKEQQTFVIAEDISNSKKNFAQLKKAKEKAQESTRLKSAFLANMSHEIRTPLNAVLGFAQLFDCEEFTTEELDSFKESIIKGSHSLLNLIQGIIKLSELQSEKFTFKSEKINISEFSEELIKFGKSGIKNVNKDIQLLYEFSSFENYIYSDKGYLLKVMEQLIDNAVKFTDSGFIKIGIYSRKSKTFLYVQDSGIGISEKQIKFIFDKFRQAEQTETNLHRGIGMGLALSKEIITKMNGSIAVNSEIGTGSRFEISLPNKT
ncbi:MAG: PAS domain S-box protein [Bacteroidota bacterium]|nr:PAS domain S-box protein [Bacteroidota bacterium]